MTAINYSSCEDRVLAHEGSKYTDGVHPYDPGGPTRWGITIADAKMYWKSNATSEDVRTMPVEIAKGIYRSKYWKAVHGDDLPSGVDDSIFDYAVNSGWGRAGKVLRRVLGLPDNDWHVTGEVLAAALKQDHAATIDSICNERLRFLRALSIWPTYGNGWTTRVNDVRTFSQILAKAPANAAPIKASVKEQNTGHGWINPPTAQKKTVLAIGGAGSGGAIVWAQNHPQVTVAIVAVAAIGIAVAIHFIQQNHKRQQEAKV